MALADSDLDALIAATPAKGPAGDDIDHLIATTPAKTTDYGGIARAAMDHANQVTTFGFADEMAAAGSTPIMLGAKAADWAGSKLGISEHKPYLDQVPWNPVDVYRNNRDLARRQLAEDEEKHPDASTAGTLFGVGLSALAPMPKWLNVGPGAKVGEAALKGAAVGGLAGLGGSQADLTRGDVGGAARDTLIGAGLGGAIGGAAHGLGSIAGAVGRRAGAKVAAIDEDVARAAAKDAAKVTGTAKSTLGGVTQDANRTVENLMRLEQSMTPEQRELYAALEQTGTLPALKEKLAQTGLEKVPGAAGRIDTATQALEEAATSEPQRAAALADQRLSGDALKQQLYARLKRYGLPAVGGAVLGGMGFGAHGALTGAALGGALGNNFRPMMHSLLRMGRLPVVQRALASGVQRLAGGAARLEAPTISAARGLESEAAPVLGAAASENFRNAFPQLKAAMNGNGTQQPNEALGANP